MNAGVTILLHNALDTFNSTESYVSSDSSNGLVPKRYFYQNVPLTNDK